MMSLLRFRSLAYAAALTLLALTSGLAGPAQAAVGRWEAAGPYGGHISALAVAPNDRRIVYAGTAAGFIFRSADAGTSWTPATGDFPAAGVSDLVVDPADASTAYAAICSVVVELVTYKEGGVFKTTDGGRTWQLLTEQGVDECEVYELAIDPHQPSRILAATYSGLRVSEDGGASWQASPGLAGEGIVKSVVFSKTPGKLFAVHHNHGVLKSVDGGATWTPVNAGLPAERWRISGLAITPLVTFPAEMEVLYARTFGTADTVFRSIDAGVTWTPASGGLGGRQVYDLAVVRNGVAVYAATDAGIFQTGNGGFSWTAPSPGRASRPTRALALPVAPLGVVYAGHLNDGVSKYSESLWRAANRGLTGVPILRMVAAPSDGSVRYAFTSDYRILRSLDSGATWRPNGRGIGGAPFTIAIHPHNPRVAYAGGFQGGLWKTTDAGATWRRISGEETACMSVVSLQIDPRTPSTVYAAGQFASCPQFPDVCLGFKSTDAGESWSCMEGLPAQDVWSLALAPSAPATLYVSTESFPPRKPVFKSTDAGQTWRPRSGGLPRLGASTLVVSPRDARTVYVVSSQGLYKSVDGAATWSPARNGLPAGSFLGSLVISPANPSHLFILTHRTGPGGDSIATVFRSVNAGASWTPVSAEGLPDRALTLTAEPGALYAATVLGIYRLAL